MGTFLTKIRKGYPDMFLSLNLHVLDVVGGGGGGGRWWCCCWWCWVVVVVVGEYVAGWGREDAGMMRGWAGGDVMWWCGGGVEAW